jgi:hypothetical protein
MMMLKPDERLQRAQEKQVERRDDQQSGRMRIERPERDTAAGPQGKQKESA